MSAYKELKEIAWETWDESSATRYHPNDAKSHDDRKEKQTKVLNYSTTET